MHALLGYPAALAALFRAVLQASWQGSLAIVLVLLARRVLGARVPARWHHLLWLLVLARLLVPAVILPRSPASLENIPVIAHPFGRPPSVSKREALAVAPGFVSPVPPASARFPTVAGPAPGPAAATPRGKVWAAWRWAAWVWLGGVLLLAGWLAACAFKLRAKLCHETTPAEESVLAIWQGCCRRWLGRAAPRLLAADWVDSPALVGWRRPTLLIPRRSPDTFSAQDWEHVFAHEIAHLRWRDHWTQFFLLAAWCIHWFNPVVWLGFRRLRADRELAADEWVLRHLQGDRALAYGETLFKTLAHGPARHAFQPGMIGISEDGAQMKQRLRRIAAFLPRRRFPGSLLGLTAVLALAAVVLGQGTPDQMHTKDLPKSDVVIDLAQPSATPSPTPVAPTPAPTPAAPVAKARVVNAQGQPVADASIRPYTEIRGDTWQFPATKHNKTHTDQDGQFSYSIPGYTKVGVMVVARGYARQLAVIPYGGPSPDIVLGPGVEVSGRLLKDGRPVPDIEIGIAQVNHESARFLDEIIAKTDQNGRFVLPDVAPADHYEIHAKRDSLRALGVTAPKHLATGEPGTSVPVGDLLVEPGMVVPGRIMLPDGSLPAPDEYTTEPDGRRLRNATPPVQLHVYREGAYDYQYINLEPDLRFAFPAFPGEEISLSAWVPGYKLRGKQEETTVRITAGLKPVEMVYDPESAEARERASHPVFAPPPTPTPAPPSAARLEADAKAARAWADQLAAQPHHTEAEWRERLRKVTVGMTFEEVFALLPARTVSIDYLQRDEYDEADVHTSFYALDGEFAVALTFDFKGDEAWNAAGQPKPRPRADENHLIRPPVLMRHDGRPDKDNEIQLEKAHKA